MPPLQEYRLLRTQMDRLFQISEADSQANAWAALEGLTQDLGFDYAGVVLVRDTPGGIRIESDKGSPRFAAALQDYIALGLDRIDPSAKLAQRTSGLMMSHDSLTLTAPEDRLNGQKVLAFIRSRGFFNHSVIPLELPTSSVRVLFVFGLLVPEFRPEFEVMSLQCASVLKLAAQSYLSTKTRMLLPDGDQSLTQEEARILTAVAQGMSLKEIARHNQKSASTVRHQLASARHRLNARSTAHAVALAVATGAIAPT